MPTNPPTAHPTTTTSLPPPARKEDAPAEQEDTPAPQPSQIIKLHLSSATSYQLGASHSTVRSKLLRTGYGMFALGVTAPKKTQRGTQAKHGRRPNKEKVRRTETSKRKTHAKMLEKRSLTFSRSHLTCSRQLSSSWKPDLRIASP